MFKINNSFAIKNDKIPHFENLNHARHLKDVATGSKQCQTIVPLCLYFQVACSKCQRIPVSIKIKWYTGLKQVNIKIIKCHPAKSRA